MAALVDTNVLVYRYDPRFPSKQAIATDWLRGALAEDGVRIPHQALVELVAAVTRSAAGQGPLLTQAEAVQEAEELLAQFPILYPTAEVVRLAMQGMATYQLSWFDAHMWAYAEHFGLHELWTEDFQDGRLYGSVRVVNPFTAAGKACNCWRKYPAGKAAPMSSATGCFALRSEGDLGESASDLAP